MSALDDAVVHIKKVLRKVLGITDHQPLLEYDPSVKWVIKGNPPSDSILGGCLVNIKEYDKAVIFYEALTLWVVAKCMKKGDTYHPRTLAQQYLKSALQHVQIHDLITTKHAKIWTEVLK